MTEKWLIAPGQERVIDIERASKLKIGLVGGQVDVIAHDEPGIRIEVHNVTVKDLRIESDGTQIEIDHPQIGWDNFLEVFRNFGAGGPKAEISVAVPRDIALTLGVVSAGALVSGLTEDARLNTVSGDLIVDTHRGDLNVNTVSGDVQVRGWRTSLEDVRRFTFVDERGSYAARTGRANGKMGWIQAWAYRERYAERISPPRPGPWDRQPYEEP